MPLYRTRKDGTATYEAKLYHISEPDGWNILMGDAQAHLDRRTASPPVVVITTAPVGMPYSETYRRIDDVSRIAWKLGSVWRVKSEGRFELFDIPAFEAMFEPIGENADMHRDPVAWFVRWIREQSKPNDTMFRLVVTSEGHEVSSDVRTSDDLRRDGIAMRNLRGEWIR